MKYLIFTFIVCVLYGCGSASVKEQKEQVAGPNPSYVSAKGITIIPQDYLWKDFKHYRNAGAVNFFVRKINPGETLKQAITRTRFEAHHGEAVARYNTPQMTIPIKNHTKGACYFVTDARGRPARIKRGDGLKAYTFTNRVLEDEARKIAGQNKVSALQADVRLEQGKVDGLNREIINVNRGILSIESKLARSKAYKNNQCILVAQEKVPPRPVRKKQSYVKVISEGYCLDKMYYRNSNWRARDSVFPAHKQKALAASYALYVKNEQNPIYSCHKVEFTQWNDVGCNFAGGLLDIIGMGRSTRQDCFQNLLRSCTTKAVNSCNYDYDNWVNIKNRIEAEPSRLQNECRSNVNLMAQNKLRIPDLKKQIEEQKVKVSQRKTLKDNYSNFVNNNDYLKQIPIQLASCRI